METLQKSMEVSLFSSELPMITGLVLSGLPEQLFKHEENRLNGVLISLNQENKKLTGSAMDGFLYEGKFYLPKGDLNLFYDPSLGRTSLHKQLTPAMDDYIKDEKSVQEDKKLIMQTVFRVCKPCKLTQDVRDALPEPLALMFAFLKQLDRTREPAYTLEGDPRAMRQYKKILPKIQFYAASRLIY
jgi:hypothetical protein